MSAASNHAETQLLKYALTTESLTRPTAWYVALFTTDPTDAGSGTEVSGTSYARQSVSFTVTGDTASNSATVTFPAAGSNWGTITHVGIYDADSSGNLWFHGAVTTSKSIDTGDTFQITSGNLDITLA
jgi:hypothetical protein